MNIFDAFKAGDGLVFCEGNPGYFAVLIDNQFEWKRKDNMYEGNVIDTYLKRCDWRPYIPQETVKDQSVIETSILEKIRNIQRYNSNCKINIETFGIYGCYEMRVYLDGKELFYCKGMDFNKCLSKVYNFISLDLQLYPGKKQ